MRDDDVPYDGEAKTGALRARLDNAVEPFEHPLPLALWNSRTGILDAKVDLNAMVLETDRDDSVFGGISQCIIDEIDDQFMQQGRVALKRDRFRLGFEYQLD